MASIFEDTVKQGYVRLKSKLGVWQKKWLVLKKASSRGPVRLEKHLEEKSSNVGQHVKFIDLSSTVNVYILPHDIKKNCVCVVFKDQTSRSFACDTETEAQSWEEAIQKCVVRITKRSLSNTSQTSDTSLLKFENEELFRVCMLPSLKTAFCGECLLEVTSEDIILHDINDTNKIILQWSLNALRRYGKDTSKFTFEAGRHCETGEGLFVFSTKEGDKIYGKVQSTTNRIADAQRLLNRRRQVARTQSNGSIGSTEYNNNSPCPTTPVKLKLKQSLSTGSRSSEPPPLPPRPPNMKDEISKAASGGGLPGQETSINVCDDAPPAYQDALRMQKVDGTSSSSEPDYEGIYEEKYLSSNFKEFLKKRKEDTE